MNRLDFLRQRLGARWVICRNTECNHERYGNPVTRTAYLAANREWCGRYPELAAVDSSLPPEIEREMRERAAGRIEAALADAARELYAPEPRRRAASVETCEPE